MPAAGSYEEALERIPQFADSIGDDVIDTIDAEGESGNQIDGFAVEHGNNTVLVLGTPVEDHFKIQFSYNATEDALRSVLQSVVDEPLEPGEEAEVDITEAHLEQAQRSVAERIGGLGDESAEKMRRKLVQVIAQPPAAYELDTLDGLRVTGFEVSYKIYPYDESFSVARFGDGVQTVLTAGIPGRMYLQRIYGFRSTDPGTEDTGESEGYDYDPTFQ